MQLTTEIQNRTELHTVKLTGNVEISPDVFVISWKRTKDFVPGQVIKITADLSETPRIYSICSGNKEDELYVLYNVKPGGILTPRLSKMKEGDELHVSDAYGNFFCDESPAYWISTGTGIAPFHSMVRSGIKKNKKLLHGVSYANQFYFEDYLGKELGGELHQVLQP